jgi:hypothetical protein
VASLWPMVALRADRVPEIILSEGEGCAVWRAMPLRQEGLRGTVEHEQVDEPSGEPGPGRASLPPQAASTSAPTVISSWPIRATVASRSAISTGPLSASMARRQAAWTCLNLPMSPRAWAICGSPIEVGTVYACGR